MALLASRREVLGWFLALPLAALGPRTGQVGAQQAMRVRLSVPYWAEERHLALVKELLEDWARAHVRRVGGSGYVVREEIGSFFDMGYQFGMAWKIDVT
jgi:hypothetical protein